MKEKWKKIILWRPKAWLVALGVVGLLLLALLPLYRMALYSIPWYDDYIFGKFVKSFLAEERSLWSALKGAAYCAKVQWYAWQGCFSCSFLNSLVPIVWGEDLYFLGPMFFITILTVSVFVLMRVLVRNVLASDQLSGITLPAAAAITVVMLIHTAQAGFYWYVGGSAYIAMHSFFLLLTAGWVRLLTKPGKVTAVLLVVWTMFAAVVVGGANFVTGLQGVVLGLSLCILGVLLKRKQTMLLLPSVIINLFCFYKSVSAPGNSVRGAAYKSVGLGMGPLEAIGNSFMEAFRHIGEFTGIITVAIVITLLPIIWQMLKHTEFSFRYPGLVLLWSFCFYATGYTPQLYGSGSGGLGRTLNVVKITYQILLLINLVYWLGWANRKWRQKEILKVFDKGAPFLFYVAMGALMLGIFAMESNQAGNYSSYGAYYWVHTGEANEFHKEYLARVDAIKNGGDVVTVPPYHFRPWFLCSGELTDNPNNEANSAMANWYGKAGIICIDENTGQNE